MTKYNGSGNGEDKKKKDKILSFPTLAERDRLRKEKKQREDEEDAKIRRAQHGTKPKSVPFFNFGNIPPFTGTMVAIFVLVHIPIFVLFTHGQRLEAFYMLGFVPGYFTGAAGGMPWFAPAGIVTHMFIHGGWMHLLFNTVMMIAMGMLFEKQYGSRTTLKFFFICGIVGALFYFLTAPLSTIPVIGASGGISGLFGASLMLLAQQGQIGGRRGPWPVIAFWLIFMLVIGIWTETAWQAHTGGFIAGVALIYLMQKRKLRL